MSETRPVNPKLRALRAAADRLRQAPLLDKAKHADAAANLSLAMLEDLDRRVARLERREAALRAVLLAKFPETAPVLLPRGPDA